MTNTGTPALSLSQQMFADRVSRSKDSLAIALMDERDSFARVVAREAVARSLSDDAYAFLLWQFATIDAAVQSKVFGG